MFFFVNFKKKNKIIIIIIFFWIFTLCSLHFQVFHPQEIWQVLQELHRYHLSNNHSKNSSICFKSRWSPLIPTSWIYSWCNMTCAHAERRKICFNLNAKFPGPHMFSLSLPCLVLLRNQCGLGLRCLYF